MNKPLPLPLEINEQKYNIKKIVFFLFLISFLAGGWCFSIGSWNQISRYDAIFSFVEEPAPGRPNPDYLSFRIDHYITHELGGVNTGDFSKYKGHFYSNKAPGQILLGTLIYFPLYYFDKWINGFTDDLWHDVKNCYIINLFTSVIPTSLAVVFLFLSMLILGVPPPKSAFWSLIYGLATPALSYSSMAWGHPLAAAFFVFALYCYLKKGKKNIILCGLWSGLACLTDYLSALVPLLFGVLFLIESLRDKKGAKETVKNLFYLFLGGLAPLILFALYHAWNFGSPFTPATVYNNPIFLEKEKLGGTFGAFKPLILLQLLFSSYRGLFYLSPILLAAVPGFLYFRKKAPLIAWGLLSAFLLLLIANASFNGWHGGTTLSPRYLIVLLPILPILGAFAPMEKLWQKLVWGLLALFSFFTALIASYTQPLAGEGMNDPFFGYILPRFLEHPNGAPSSRNTLRAYEMITELKLEALKNSSFSIGEVFGLSGHHGMILLLLLLGLLGFFLWKELKTSQKLPLPEPESLPSEEKEEGCHTSIFYYFLPFLALLFLFLFPGDEVWINDEPALIFRALQGNDGNTFAAHGLQGTFQVKYGPIVVWFYQILLLFTLHPVFLVSLKTLFTLGVLFYALKKLAPVYKLDPFMMLAFLLASPFMWHFARKLWDNVFLMPMGFLLAAFLFTYFETGKKRFLTAGSFTGSLMIFLHPLATPVAMALPFSLLFQKKNWGKKILEVLLSSMITILLPAFYFLPQIWQKSSFFGEKLTGKGGENSTALWELLTGPYRIFAGTGFRNGMVKEYKGLLPTFWEGVLNVSEVILPIFLALTALMGVIFLFQKYFRKKDASPAILLGVWAFFALLFKFIFDSFLRLPPHFHYFTVGVPPLAILLFTGISSWQGKRKIIFLQGFTALFLLLTGSLFFLIHTQEGTKSYVYGSTIGNQYKVAECFTRKVKEEKVKTLENFVGNYKGFPHAFQILADLANRSYVPSGKKNKAVKRKYIIHYVSPDPANGTITLSRVENGGLKDLFTEE